MSQGLSIVVLLVGLIGVEGYIYDARALYSFLLFSSMAVHTAALFVVMGAGTLWLRSHVGLVAVLANPHAGGIFIRPLLAPLAALLVAIGWLTLKGERSGLYDADVDVALFATAGFVVVGSVAWRLAARLNVLHEHFDAEHARLGASRRELEDLRTALNEHAIVAFTDAQGRITSMNRQFCDISGYLPEELLGGGHRIGNWAIIQAPSSPICGRPSTAARCGTGKSGTARRAARAIGWPLRSSLFSMPQDAARSAWRWAPTSRLGRSWKRRCERARSVSGPSSRRCRNSSGPAGPTGSATI